MPPILALHTEPHGSVFWFPPRCLLRRALGRDPTRRPGAARTCRRFHHGPCREIPHDPHGHEEARRRLGAGRARADLQARPAPTGARDGLDRGVPPALGFTLRRVGQGCRGTETEGEGRWTQEERVSPNPSRTTRRRNGSPNVSWSSREPSTPRRGSCSRRGPSPSCSCGGGHRSRLACPSFPARSMFVWGARTVSCSALPHSPWSSSVSTSK